jgi:hypothetical protein
VAVQLPTDEHETALNDAWGSAPALGGAVTEAPAAQVPEVSVATIACWSPEVSTYAPVAVQLPAEVHETPLIEVPGRLFPASAGAVIDVACAQTPAVSVAAMASGCGELSMYGPVAVQLPTDEHETALSDALGSACALAGAVTSVAWAQVPEASVAAIDCCFAELSV